MNIIYYVLLKIVLFTCLSQIFVYNTLIKYHKHKLTNFYVHIIYIIKKKRLNVLLILLLAHFFHHNLKLLITYFSIPILIYLLYNIIPYILIIIIYIFP